MDNTISKRLAAYDKTKKVIESCVSHKQLVCADRMIDNFWLLFGNDAFYLSSLHTLWLEKSWQLTVLNIQENESNSIHRKN